MAQQMALVDELVKYEGFAKAAMKRNDYREAVFYSNKLVEHCSDSVKHVKMKIKASIMHSPNDLSQTIKFTYDCQ